MSAGIRNAAKALIVRDGCLLTLAMRDEDGSVFYILPGGGQEPGETLAEAVRRECREELGADLVVGELRFVREYRREVPHRVEFTFRCALASDLPARGGDLPDGGQLGAVWLPLARLPQVRFYPLGLRAILASPSGGSGTVYLGDLA